MQKEMIPLTFLILDYFILIFSLKILIPQQEVLFINTPYGTKCKCSVQIGPIKNNVNIHI